MSTSSSRATSTATSCSEVISAFLNERKPAVANHSVLRRVQRAGNVCVMVAHGTPLLGPVTLRLRRALPELRPRLLWLLRADGVPERPSLSGWSEGLAGMDEVDVVRVHRTFHTAREPFREESEAAGR